MSTHKTGPALKR